MGICQLSTKSNISRKAIKSIQLSTNLTKTLIKLELREVVNIRKKRKVLPKLLEWQENYIQSTVLNHSDKNLFNYLEIDIINEHSLQGERFDQVKSSNCFGSILVYNMNK